MALTDSQVHAKVDEMREPEHDTQPGRDDILTRSEAAVILGVHPDTISAWVARGELHALPRVPKRGVRLRFLRSAVLMKLEQS